MIPAFLADRENRKRKGQNESQQHVDGSFDDYDASTDGSEEFDDSPTLESKGSTPPQSDPQADARAQISIDNARAERERAEAERVRIREEEERKQLIARSAAKNAQAYNTGQSYVGQQINARGIDADLARQFGLHSNYNTGLDQVRNSVAEDDINPASAYNYDTLFNDARESALGGYRSDLKGQINAISDDGFAYDSFNDTADDEILDSILKDRYSTANSRVEGAFARGQLNDVGYEKALADLGIANKSAYGDIQDLGQGVLTGYRDELSGLRDTELDNVGNATFADPYNTGRYEERLTGRVGDLTNRLEGDLYSATSDQTFFDPDKIISGAGAAQGFFNPTSSQSTTGTGTGVTGTENPLLNAFTTEEQKKKKPTSGNTGVF